MIVYPKPEELVYTTRTFALLLDESVVGKFYRMIWKDLKLNEPPNGGYYLDLIISGRKNLYDYDIENITFDLKPEGYFLVLRVAPAYRSIQILGADGQIGWVPLGIGPNFALWAVPINT